MRKPAAESRAWSSFDINAALIGAGAMAATGVKYLNDHGRPPISPELLLTLTAGATTILGCNTPQPTQEITQTPDQALRHVSGLDINTIIASNNLNPGEQTWLALTNADFVSSVFNNNLVFPKNEVNPDEPLTKGGIVEAVSYALGKPANTISPESINSSFLPNVITFGTEGEFDIQPVIVQVDGQEQIVLFGRVNRSDWGLISFVLQPFDLFSSQGNGITIQGVDKMYPSFLRGSSFNFTGMLLSGGDGGVVFSHALYFELGADGKLQLVLRDDRGTLSGPVKDGTPIAPNNDGVFNASFISNPIPTPLPENIPTPLPPAVEASKIFTADQLTVLTQHGLSFDANNNLVQKFKDASGNEQSITIGRLEADGLHITDYGTGTESIIKPESIVNFHQDINELFPDILKGNDSKDANVVWAYNPEKGWFKQIKDGENTEENAFNDGRIIISELLDSAEINKLFPPGTVPADFFVNIEQWIGGSTPSDVSYGYISTYPGPGSIRFEEYYFKQYGLSITKENNSFHWFRTYYLKTPSGKDAVVRTQVILNKDGKTKTLEHFVYEPGFEPQGDNLSNLVFPLIPPPPGTEERKNFDDNIEIFRFRGQLHQIGWEFSQGLDDVWSFFNLPQITETFGLTKDRDYHKLGPMNSPPSAIQLKLLVPGSWENSAVFAPGF